MLNRRQTAWRPVLGLLALAPFVGEFLLGNMTLSELPIGLLLAPMYGFGALLVREIGRRRGGWPTMVLLAAAYALFEEGPVDQLLWNDSYAGHDLLHGPSFLPSIGMSVELTQGVLALHTIWSICVPIALIEAMVPGRRETPWLSNRGLLVVGGLFLAGAGLVFGGNYSEEHFLATPWQIGAVAAVIVLLVVLAVTRPPEIVRVAGNPPQPWQVGLIALALTSLYWGPGTLITGDWFEWIGVAVWFGAVGLGGWLVLRWTRRTGWTERHTCALAVGAALTYVWISFPVRPESGGSMLVDLASNAVFGVVALIVLMVAMRRAGIASKEPAGLGRTGPDREGAQPA